ncbi:MAG: carboxypeptidase-like regulatory domain-containing protein, partial [Bacteroidia bacterium]|nr:carboxypeptidase-like regulatory domain-containing protein [Bacteroidia bacterium]
MFKTALTLFLILALALVSHGQALKGVVKDSKTKEALIGATIAVKGGNIGTTTDLDGKFTLEGISTPPIVLIVSYLGFDTKEMTVNGLTEPLTIYLTSSQKALKEVSVVESRLTEKQRESAITV